MSDLDGFDFSCDSVKFNSEFSNELYLYFYVNRFYRLYDFHNCFKVKDLFLFIPNIIIIFSMSLLFPLFLLFFSSGDILPNGSKSLYLKRSINSYKKIRKILPDDTYILDANFYHDFKKHDNNLFSQPFRFRLCALFFIPFINIKNLLNIFLFVFKNLPFLNIFEVVEFYKIRLAHFSTYQIYLKYFLSNNDFNTFYTSNKDCRFAGLDIYISKKFDLHSVCLPHGLEYGFKLPLGLPGEVFFCLSKSSKKFFSQLYNCDSKFFYDENVNKSIFSIKYAKPNPHKKIIFFTESRGVFINKYIISELLKSKVEFFVHLHPGDSLTNYNDFPDELFNTVDYPIFGNVVLARKSTVLLEATFNNSIPIAVLVNNSDKISFSLFPSLHSNLIYKFHNFNSLIPFLRQL